jgi:hypothetical protein
MPKPEIEEFAKILVREVRDAAIRSNDLRLRPDVTHAIAKRWRESAGTGQLESIAKTLIPDVVDNTIYYLLHAIDEGALQLSFIASNGQTVNLTKEGLGELAGWYAGEWNGKYTKERFVDDFSDLRKFFD